jgi:transcriptional regulator with XRE-family HTH domain
MGKRHSGHVRASDPMGRVRLLFEKSGLSLDELGQRMGYSGEAARKSAWQFLNKTTDPRLSMLRRFTEAINVPLAELFR